MKTMNFLNQSNPVTSWDRNPKSQQEGGFCGAFLFRFRSGTIGVVKNWHDQSLSLPADPGSSSPRTQVNSSGVRAGVRIACVALLLGAGAGEAAETVQFTSAVAPPTRFQSRLAAMRGIAPRQRAPDQLSGTLYRPVNGERTPAIVVLHTCDGPGPAEADWASRLAESGYIVLVVDSYGPRGVVETCTRLPAHNVGPQVFDAYGGLAWLRRQPSVDADRVAVMGRAHGATSALDAVLARGTSTFFEERFAAVVALHP